MSDLPFPDIKLQATLQSEVFHCFLAFCTGSVRPASQQTCNRYNKTPAIFLYNCTFLISLLQ